MNMRVVLWNCKGGLKRKDKVEYLLGLKPDIAVIPEIRKAHIPFLQPKNSIWLTNLPEAKGPKGLGVLSYGDYSLHELTSDPEMEIYLPIRVKSTVKDFNLLAVWNFYHLCKKGRFRGVKGENGVELSALRHYRSTLNDPCLLVGDLNMGPTLTGNGFSHFSAILEEMGLSDLSKCKHESSSDSRVFSTFRMKNKGRTFHHHLDHVFGSASFESSLKSYQTDSRAMDDFSDHAPVLVDFVFR